MLRIFQKIMKQGIVTEDYYMSAVPARFRGQLELKYTRCRDCLKCVEVCPTQAISAQKKKLVVDHDACIFCGACVDCCERLAIRHSLEHELAHLGGQLAEAGSFLTQKIHRVLGRSLAVRHLDVGSCNACDFELSALLNPIYDLSQYGIDFVASPRHADLLMVTGVVTRNLRQALEMTVEATPKPRLIMAVGACACSGKVYGETYAISEPLTQIVPVDIFVPGCPPRPQALIYGLMLALDRI